MLMPHTRILIISITIFVNVVVKTYSQGIDQFNQSQNNWMNGQSNPNNSTYNTTYPNGNNATNIQNQVNQQAMQMMGYDAPVIPPSDPTQLHSFIIEGYNSQIKTRKEQQLEYVKSILSEDLPPFNEYESSPYQKEAQIYVEAYKEIQNMISLDSFSLTKAIFIVENTYYNNTMKYTDFTNSLNAQVKWVELIIKREKLDTGSQLAKNYALQKLFSGEIYKYDSKGEIVKTHYPFKYDFEDYMGDADWSKMFVSKLLKTTKGQCHSMPLLYLLLAERMNTKAWLSLAPEHSFIKFQDGTGNWYNFETTNGSPVSDDWLISSGFITAEAIKSNTFLDTLGIKEMQAATIVDLALGYRDTFGYDDFLWKMVEYILTLDSDNIQGAMLMADMLTLITRQELKNVGNPPLEKIGEYPKANESYKKMIEAYDFIDALGYQSMPEDVYQKWLKTLEEEKRKGEKEILNNQIKQSVKGKN